MCPLKVGLLTFFGMAAFSASIAIADIDEMDLSLAIAWFELAIPFSLLLGFVSGAAHAALSLFETRNPLDNTGATSD